MSDVLVLGIGNPLLGDDGLGVEVVRRLRASDSLPAVELLDGGTAGVYLLPVLEGRSHILVVDAMDFGGTPGQVMRLHPSELPTRCDMRLSEHQVTFHEVLALMNLLEITPKEVVLLGVQPRSTLWGESLSPEVQATIPDVVEEILDQVKNWVSIT